VIHFNEPDDQAINAALKFVDSFSLIPGEPKVLYPKDWLSPFEADPQVAPYIQILRSALRVVGTTLDLFRILDENVGGTDPTYPLPYPVPYPDPESGK
jgi:hypothetical protein